MKKLVVEMTADKTTKGAVRFSDKGAYPKTIYLRKEEVKELGDPDAITITIEPKE